jgi:hypothetical protein
MTLQIVFWVIFILACFGSFAASPERAWLERPSRIVLLVLIGILGYAVFEGARR